MRIFRFLVLSLMLVLPRPVGAGEAGSVLVFAASSLSEVMSDLGQHYEGETGTEIIVSLGASSLLARQIEAGAPADIYVSANNDWARYLVDRGAGGDRAIIAQNRLAVVGRADVPMISDLAELSAAGLAIGDPGHVPAGIYAQQALMASGVWASVEPDVRRTANVRLATVLAAIGAVDYAIAYASDARSDNRLEIKYLIPQALHRPIGYFAVQMPGASEPGKRFFDFLRGDVARGIFVDHGFIGVERP